MEKLTVLAVILVNFILQSDAKVTIPFKQEIYPRSSDIQVSCTISDEIFVGWFKNNTKIKEFAKKDDIKGQAGIYYSPGGSPNEKVYYIYLPPNLPFSVGGKYECRGKTNIATTEIVIRFDVNGLETNQQLHVGKDETIVVGAMSYPLSTFKWKKDNVPIDFKTNSRLKMLKDGSIQITNVQKSDAGVYDVHINWQDRSTSDKKITVIVVEKPTFISTPKPAKFIGVTGYDYKFCFNVTGSPTPTLEFFKSNIQFDTTNNRYSIDGSCINIAKLEQMDVAPYKCTAKNSAAEISAVVEIERLGVNPTLNPFAQNLYKANVGDSFELKCSGKGDPTPTLEWSFNGNVLASSKNEAVLVIDDMKNKDSGNYTCTVKNGLIYQGKELAVSKTIQLLAITKPSINDVKSTLKVYSYVANPNKIPMRCYFFGVPTPSVTIHKDGVKLATGTGSANYELETKTKAHFGDYNCTGANTHGTSSQTVQVLYGSRPGKPTTLSATKTCKEITLIWKAPLSNGNMPVLQYILTYNMTTKQNILEKIRQYRLPYIFSPNTTYKFNLTARNVIGIGPGALIDVTTDPYCKPGAPGIYNLRTKEYGPTILVKWNPPADDGFDSDLVYKVYWRPKKDPAVNWKVSADLKKTTLEFEVPDEFQPGSFEFKVTATNKAGESRPDVRVVEIMIKEMNSTKSTPTSYDDNATSTTSSTTSATAPSSKSPTAELPTLPDHRQPPIAGKRTSGLSKGVIAGIVIAILLIVLITIDLFCCFFNSCGVIFCCQRACCAKQYSPDGKPGNEMEKLNKAENV